MKSIRETDICSTFDSSNFNSVFDSWCSRKPLYNNLFSRGVDCQLSRGSVDTGSGARIIYNPSVRTVVAVSSAHRFQNSFSFGGHFTGNKRSRAV